MHKIDDEVFIYDDKKTIIVGKIVGFAGSDYINTTYDIKVKGRKEITTLNSIDVFKTIADLKTTYVEVHNKFIQKDLVELNEISLEMAKLSERVRGLNRKIHKKQAALLRIINKKRVDGDDT